MILLTFIKLPFVIKICVLSFLSGRFTQALLYVQTIDAYTSDQGPELQCLLRVYEDLS